MSDMYVWEVSHHVQYDGVLRSVLIKDDGNTIKKVKDEVIGLYNLYCFYEDIKREKILEVSKIKTLEDFQQFKLSLDSRVVVKKVQVI